MAEFPETLFPGLIKKKQKKGGRGTKKSKTKKGTSATHRAKIDEVPSKREKKKSRKEYAWLAVGKEI